MKQYECIQVNHHNYVGSTIANYQKDGWSLYSYQVAAAGGNLGAHGVNHYLLFEREISQKVKNQDLAKEMADQKILL